MKLTKITAALVAAGLALPAFGASDSATLEKLAARLERLEARNAELEKEVKVLKGESEQVTKSLDNERLSQYEPELTTRLKATEKDVLEMKKSAKIAESLEGIKATAALATVVQGASGLPSGTEDAGTQLNYRADVTVELPLKPIGDIEHKLFGGFRMGQGQGLNTAFSRLGYFASAPNALAFRASGASPDDSVVILGQAWYQAAIPIPFGGFKPYSRETLEITFGKMDIFGFFDQNAAAGDESKQFLNSVFVHNPLLDAGRRSRRRCQRLPAGRHHFLCATRPTRRNRGACRWASSGPGIAAPTTRPASRSRSSWRRLKPSSSCSADSTATTAFTPGTAAPPPILTARRPSTPGSASRSTSASATASISSLATESWSRANCRSTRRWRQVLSSTAATGVAAPTRCGIAGSWLQTGSAYSNAGAAIDINGDGIPDYAFIPSGAETVAELYYRYRISPQFELSPDFQWLTQAGGNPDAKSVTVLGLRANIVY